MLYFCVAMIIICFLMICIYIGKWMMADYKEDEALAGQRIFSWIIMTIITITFTCYWKNKPTNTSNIYLKDQRIIMTEKTDNQVVSSTAGNYEVYYNNNTVTFVGEDGSSISFEFFEEN